MTTTEVQIEAGVLEANLEERTVTGLLLPYGEVGRTNLGRFEVEAGSITIPRDASVVMGNIGHKRERPVAPATTLTDTDAGIVATFRIADTEDGDALLAEIDDKRQAGTPMALSAEVRDIVLRAGKAVSGFLFGAAFVDQGAFPSAALLAADTPDAEPSFDYTALSDEQRQGLEAFLASLTKTTDPADAEPDNKPEEGDNPKEEIVPIADTIPNTMEASAPAAPARTSLRALTNVLARANFNNDATMLAELAEPDGHTLFAALSDIKYDYAGGVGENIIQPAYIGELWSGRTKPRLYIPLIDNQPLTSSKIVGWKWGVKPSVAAWSGNKSTVPSNNPTTDDYSLTAIKYAGAHDIAREFTDFGLDEFWNGYLKAMTDSYSEVTDAATLAALIAGATTSTSVAVTGIDKATTALVDGALAVLAKDVPTFAIVGADVYRSLLLQGKDSILGTLNLSLGLEEGALGGFAIRPSSAAGLTGKVLVGAKSAATSYELPGSPIRVDAQDLAKGGVDSGFFGYHVAGINEATALQLVTVAA